MYVIGLTGGIASGKTRAAAVLRELGAHIIDADALARTITSPGGAGAAAILHRFGTLDRKALGAIVFSDPVARADLNRIVHPLVHKEILIAIRDCPKPLCVLDVPLLFEAGMDILADETWVVHVPREEQIRRILKRDGLTREEAIARIDSQMPTWEKLRRGDIAIDASGPKEATRQTLIALWEAAVVRAKGRGEGEI